MSADLYLSECSLSDCDCSFSSYPSYSLHFLPLSPSSSSLSFSFPSSYEITPGPSPRGGSSLIYFPFHPQFSRSGFFLFGGSNRLAQFFNDFYWFDISSCRWLKISHGSSAPPSPRSGHASVKLGSNLYIHGGQSISLPDSQPEDDSLPLGITIYKDFYMFDVQNAKWIKINETIQRNGHTLTAIDASSAVLFGGSDDCGPCNSLYLLEVSSSNPSLVTISLIEPKQQNEEIPSARELHSAIWSKTSGELIISGGRGTDEVLHDCWAFHVEKRIWRLISQTPQRCSHSLIAAAPCEINSNILSMDLFSFGGSDGLAFFNECSVFSSAGVQLTQSPKQYCTACNGPPGWKLLAGKSSGQTIEEKQTESENKIEEKKHSFPDPRFAQCLIPMTEDIDLSSHQGNFHTRAILFGGINQENDFNDIWILSLKQINQSTS
jgi:hypothetical protein